MKLLKSHVRYTKKQRHGIFLLLAIIVVLQVCYFYVNNREETPIISKSQMQLYEEEVQALRTEAMQQQKPKVLPFNPNYINDYKGELLGMTPEEIDRIIEYRALHKWVNSAKEFQNVTKISDSLLEHIAPYFKFPKRRDYVSHSTFQTKHTTLKDLNAATATDLQQVRGIGKVLSKRIIKYRETYKGGFAHFVELKEVYGLTPEVIEAIKGLFTIKTPRPLEKIDINTATRDMLVTVKYIDYEVAHAIINYRTLHEGFKSLEELSKVKDIPLSKLDLIKLSLQIQ